MKTYKHPLSIIVPTHNRCQSIQALLESLCAQTLPAEQFEVIVVADGCTDATADLAQSHFPFAFTLLQQDAAGAATARNRGAAVAEGALLLFLDDDILPDAGLLEAHVKAHKEEKDVVIGYLPLLLNGTHSLFDLTLRAWWEERFYQMSLPGHRFHFTDLLSGNFSVASAFFAAAGGFNPDFLCAEDYELGIRLMRGGARFVYEKKAWGWHHDRVTDLRRSLQRKRDEGRAHVMMCRLYPEAIHGLKLGEIRKQDLSRRLQFLLRNPAFADRLLRYRTRQAVWYDQKRFRHHWKRLSYFLHDYSYYRGAMEFFSSPAALKRFVEKTRASLPRPLLTVDLQKGVAAASAEVDAVHPDSLVVKFGAYTVGVIPWGYGEPLHSHHLKRFLYTSLKDRYLKALALDPDFLDSMFAPASVPQKKEQETEHV